MLYFSYFAYEQFSAKELYFTTEFVMINNPAVDTDQGRTINN